MNEEKQDMKQTYFDTGGPPTVLVEEIEEGFLEIPEHEEVNVEEYIDAGAIPVSLLEEIEMDCSEDFEADQAPAEAAMCMGGPPASLVEELDEVPVGAQEIAPPSSAPCEGQ